MHNVFLSFDENSEISFIVASYIDIPATTFTGIIGLLDTSVGEGKEIPLTGLIHTNGVPYVPIHILFNLVSLTGPNILIKYRNNSTGIVYFRAFNSGLGNGFTTYRDMMARII